MWLMRSCYGIQEVIVSSFDGMMRMDWQDFITEYLIKQLNVVHVVAGHDFHFGYMGKGNPQRLKETCEKLGVGCDIIGKVEQEGITISSTYIRTLIAQGEMERAVDFLGHPHVLTNRVTHGKKIGSSSLGFPTVNLRIPAPVIVPAFGVYATRVVVDGESHMRCTVPACDYLTSHKIQNRFGKTAYLFQTPIDPSTGRPLSRRVSLEPTKDRQIRVSFDRMHAVLSQFGEIDKLIDLDHNRFCVDFFDIRAQFRCVDASGFIVVDDIPFQARVPNTQGQSEKSTPIRSTPDRSLSRINSGPVPSNDAGKEPTPLQRSRSRDGVLREPKMTSSVRYSFTKPQTQIVRDVPKEGVEAVLKLAEKLK